MHDAMFSANTFSVKEEQCQEDSFVEDKVYISETTITTGNADFQRPILHGKIKHQEESTSSDNIKTELVSVEVTQVQNDIVKIETGINADDIKIEFDNGLLYCENCEAYYEDYCIECGMLVNILNNNALNSAGNTAIEDIPNDILQIQDYFGQTGIYATRIIPAGVKFGPFTGLGTTECPWEMEGETFVLDKNKSKHMNWMKYVNPTRNTSQRNLHVIKSDDNIYYQSTCQIQAGDELLVYFGEEYGSSLNKIVKEDPVTTMQDIVRDVFACTFCCLGFSSKLHLAKHKTVCVKDAAGRFSIEELTQCPFCKIHLHLTEYLGHHMSFCCERNARKCILPTPTAKEAATALSRRKRCFRPIFRCEKCKYRTKYQSDLIEHTNNQHYKVKIYKCGICDRRFIAKESLRLHVQNTHAYIGGKNDQENYTTVYRNTLIKVEQSSSHDQKKIFKSLLCVFRANKKCLRRHVRTKHLKEYRFKCHSCEFGTNKKSHLEYHVKTIHLKEFDFKCDSCEYGSNNKNSLEYHVKTIHLKEFDFKCDSCEYRTNNRNNFEVHIKSKHLKEYRFKCHSCEFGTNLKGHLEYHVKTIHLKEFDFKCDACEYRTNYKNDFKNHIKGNHLKEYRFKCDSCEFGTNQKSRLEYHVKTIHLKQFDFKCDSCEFGTNNKNGLEYHVKTIHLKKFDFKCASCEYRTNYKNAFKKHIKNKHLKEYRFKCHSCEFGTNQKNHLEYHVKTIHLKEFDFKCDSCEYGSNNKNCLEYHVKRIHLKEFDFKCDSCKYGSNNKNSLEYHVKTIHLKEFDFKCDSCEYRTNYKDAFKKHIKSKHLKEYRFKCNSCEFGTNRKSHLEYHVRTIHLKEFDFKCDSCEYGSNNKHSLEYHVKTIHLKEFDFKCDACEYGTNKKYSLERHMKNKHLKEYCLKCDSCEFRTNEKSYLEYHVKTIHLKEFDFKCNSCEYRTNHKYHFKKHIKSKHLKEHSAT